MNTQKGQPSQPVRSKLSGMPTTVVLSAVLRARGSNANAIVYEGIEARVPPRQQKKGLETAANMVSCVSTFNSHLV